MASTTPCTGHARRTDLQAEGGLDEELEQEGGGQSDPVLRLPAWNLRVGGCGDMRE